jgi:hypothetical protein
MVDDAIDDNVFDMGLGWAIFILGFISASFSIVCETAKESVMFFCSS